MASTTADTKVKAEKLLKSTSALAKLQSSRTAASPEVKLILSKESGAPERVDIVPSKNPVSLTIGVFTIVCNVEEEPGL